jgi:hypothetical protein
MIALPSAIGIPRLLSGERFINNSLLKLQATPSFAFGEQLCGQADMSMVSPMPLH